jgi:hypothetical protein
LAAATAQGVDAGTFRNERPVTLGTVGAHRLPIDAALIEGAEPGGSLRDLRFFDAAGREVPYLLIQPNSPAPNWQAGTLIPVHPTKEASGFEVDLGGARTIDAVRLTGLPTPFMKRVRLEASADRKHWVAPVEEGTLFDLPAEGLASLSLEFPSGVFNYLRFSWDDRSSGRLPLPQRVDVRLVERAAPNEPELATPVVFERRASEAGTSRFRLRLPATRLPLVALDLDCGGDHLLRPARVLEPRLSGEEVQPVSLGTGTLRREVQGALTAASLRIPIQRPDGADLDLVVDDGNNPPLDLKAVRAIFAQQPWIYFETPDGSQLTARFGNAKLAAPRYDLEAVRGSVEQKSPALAAWGPVTTLTPKDSTGTPEQALGAFPVAGAQLEQQGFAYFRDIPAGKGGLTAVPLDPAVLAHTNGFEDLRIVDGQGQQIPYLLEKRDEPLPLGLRLEGDAAKLPPAVVPPRGKSAYRLSLPYSTLPEGRLVLATPARVFERPLTLEIERAMDAPPRSPPLQTLVEATWRHSDPEAPAPSLTLELPALGTDHLFLLVDEGDNQPLPLASAELLLPAFRLRFFRPAGQPLSLLYGRKDLSAPRYDLALLAPRLAGTVSDEVLLGAERAVAAAPPAANPQGKIFWGALIGAVLVMLALIARMLGKEASP